MSDDAPIRLNCSVCDVTFYLTARYNDKRRNDHDVFYCPNGDPQHYAPATLDDVRHGKATFNKSHLTVVKE